jgi:hypothetical protein
MRFEVLVTVKMLILVFWVVTLCGLVRWQCFRELYYPEDGRSLFIQTGNGLYSVEDWANISVGMQNNCVV